MMVWNAIKRLFQRPRAEGVRAEDLKWIEAADSEWGVRLLDVRPATLTMMSVSTNPQYAANAVSFGQDDGTSFIGKEPPIDRVTATDLRFRIDPLLADGVLFMPEVMEHKWAIFHHRGEIIFVRSWLREVAVIATVESLPGMVRVSTVRGVFCDQHEAPEYTARVLDYLLRSHALDEVYPAPLPEALADSPADAAIWCMSFFGNRAFYATPEAVARVVPAAPLRSDSVLHIAAARASIEAIEECMKAGMPLDLPGKGGQTPLHWSVACNHVPIAKLLLDRGSPVDAQTDEGATPLMEAVQNASPELVSLLIARGANVDARDQRGFTALHRAAEMGNIDLVRSLLAAGADRDIEAQGNTARSLAEKEKREAILDLLGGG